MVVTLSRDNILPSFSKTSGVIEKKQALPILGNLLFKTKDGKMQMIATDLELEIKTTSLLNTGDDDLSFTLPAKKFEDICKSLPDGSIVQINIEDDKAIILSGRSRFTIGTLSASDYPSLDMAGTDITFHIESTILKTMLENTAFSMAFQDARYYLNGMFWDFARGQMRAVATDGHRLAVSERTIKIDPETLQLLLPRKAIQSLGRLLEHSDLLVKIEVGSGFCRFTIGETVFTSKLIDGKFPDYQRVIPRNLDKTAVIHRNSIKNALQRASILSSEKYKGVKLTFATNELEFEATNAEAEDVQDKIDIDYQGDEVSIGFNATYLLDAINAINCDRVVVDFTDGLSSIVLRNPDDAGVTYVIMPMRL